MAEFVLPNTPQTQAMMKKKMQEQEEINRIYSMGFSLFVQHSAFARTGPEISSHDLALTCVGLAKVYDKVAKDFLFGAKDNATN